MEKKDIRQHVNPDEIPENVQKARVWVVNQMLKPENLSRFTPVGLEEAFRLSIDEMFDAALNPRRTQPLSQIQREAYLRFKQGNGMMLAQVINMLLSNNGTELEPMSNIGERFKI